jgi:hypothetical protein
VNKNYLGARLFKKKGLFGKVEESRYWLVSAGSKQVAVHEDGTVSWPNHKRSVLHKLSDYELRHFLASVQWL